LLYVECVLYVECLLKEIALMLPGFKGMANYETLFEKKSTSFFQGKVAFKGI